MEEKIIKYAEKTLDSVLLFYDHKGISLSHRPKIKYIDSMHPKFYGIPARCEVYYPKKEILYLSLVKSPKYKSIILLFQPYKTIQNKKFRDEIIAHEVWHLIEKERNVINIAPIIKEGTATYAAKTFCLGYFEDTIKNLKEDYENTHLVVASLVNYYTRSLKNPLISILNKEIRLMIEKELFKKIRNQAIETLENTLNPQVVKTIFGK